MKLRSTWTILDGQVFEGIVDASAVRPRKAYHCGRCGQLGHNARVCGRRGRTRRRKPAVRPFA
jgi:hypothetical protein